MAAAAVVCLQTSRLHAANQLARISVVLKTIATQNFIYSINLEMAFFVKTAEN